jgi:hypothetical protein
MTAKFLPDKAAEVCARIAEGKSLAEVCRDPKMPSVRTVMRWLAEREDFRPEYARAREAKADADADAIGDIAARTLTGEYDPASARVAIDALKWAAGKAQPKKYGEKIDLNHGGGMVVTIAGPDADL